MSPAICCFSPCSWCALTAYSDGRSPSASNAKHGRPGFGRIGTFGQCRPTCRLGRFLLCHLRLHGLDRGADLDGARLGCLWYFANHVDMEQAIVEAGTRYLHVVGKAKAPLEGAPSGAAVQVAAGSRRRFVVLRQ